MTGLEVQRDTIDIYDLLQILSQSLGFEVMVGLCVNVIYGNEHQCNLCAEHVFMTRRSSTVMDRPPHCKAQNSLGQDPVYVLMCVLLSSKLEINLPVRSLPDP